MISEIDDTSGAVAPATTGMPPLSQTRSEKAKSTKPKSATAKPAKAKAIAVKVVHDDAPAPVADPAAVTVGAAAPAEIDRIAAQIREGLAEIDGLVADVRSTAGAAVRHALRVGDLLNRAKGIVPHGQWEGWLGENVPQISLSTARRWIRLAANRSNVTDLGTAGSLSALYREVGILPERARSPGAASNVTTSAEHHGAIGAGAGDGSPGPADPAAETRDAGVTATPSPGPGTPLDAPPAAPWPMRAIPAGEAELLGLLDQIEIVMTGLTGPRIILSPGCIEAMKAFLGAFAAFVDAAEQDPRAIGPDPGDGDLSKEEAAR